MGKKRKNKCVWLTTGDLREIFSVTRTTIEQWRKKKGLPCLVQKVDCANIVRFEAEKVMLWAIKHGKRDRLQLHVYNDVVERRRKEPAGWLSLYE